MFDAWDETEKLEAKEADRIDAGKRKYFGTMAGRLDIGICGDCSRAGIRKSRYGKVGIYCNHYDCMINPIDPIEYCTNHYPSGQLSLAQMVQIATNIDPENPITRVKAGFLSNHKKERKECEDDSD